MTISRTGADVEIHSMLNFGHSMWNSRAPRFGLAPEKPFPINSLADAMWLKLGGERAAELATKEAHPKWNNFSESWFCDS